MKKGSPIFTIKQVQELEATGKIRSANWPKDMLDAKTAKPKKIEKRCPYKERLLTQLILVLSNHPDLQLEKEYRFAKPKKYRFDFAIPAAMIAVEYEGIHSFKSRHTTKTGYSKDTEKYNLAGSMGWRVLRYTANTVDKLQMEITQCLLTLTKKG